MKKLGKFLLVFGGVLLIASILAPLLFPILPYKFERIFNRIVMIGSLLAIAVFVRIRKKELTEYGAIWREDSLKLFLAGFVTPIVVLGLYALIQSFVGEATFVLKDVGLMKWAERIVVSLVACLLIGVIEEFFFRGYIYQTLKEQMKFKLVPALLITNVFYSIIHFINAKKPFVDDTPTFFDSLRLIAAPIISLGNFPQYWAGFVGLFIFGMILSALVLKSKSLYPAIGLHAGCVFFIKCDGLFMDFGSDSLIWGSKKMYDGFVGWFVLALVGVILYKLVAKLAKAD